MQQNEQPTAALPSARDDDDLVERPAEQPAQELELHHPRALRIRIPRPGVPWTERERDPDQDEDGADDEEAPPPARGVIRR
jgi:hypothetical protein